MPAQERGPIGSSRTLTRPELYRRRYPRGRYTERTISSRPKTREPTTNAIRRNAKIFAESANHTPELSEREQFWTSQMRDLRQSRKHSSHEIDVFVGRALAHYEHETTKAKKDARRDTLTTLDNRTGIEEKFRGILSRSERLNEPFSIAAIDLDKFKDINDTYGHPCGDAVLRNTASHLRKSGREHDVWGRMGGEEFIGILPGEGLREATRAMERQRIHLPETIDRKLTKNGEHQVTRDVTMSIGVVTFDPRAYEERFGTRPEQLRRILLKQGKNLADMAHMPHKDRVAILKDAEKMRKHTIFEYLTKKADKALYKAKELGRDKVVAATEDQDGNEMLINGRSLSSANSVYDRMGT